MRYLTLLLVLFTANSLADVLYHTVSVSKYKILTPSLIEFTTDFDGRTSKGTVKIRLANADFGETKNTDCLKFFSSDCQRLDEFLQKRLIKINVNKYDRNTNVYSGSVYIDGERLSHQMIALGWYKFDYKSTRNVHLVLIQKEAMCNGLGIWQGFSSMRDITCNQ